MEPTYYYVTFPADASFSYETPANGNIEFISGASITKHSYPTGDKLLQIIHDGKFEVYSTFPIVLNPAE